MLGQTLSHYHIIEKIGAGGMGEVYKAHDDRLDRDVAIKVLPSGTLGDEQTRKQFRKEALALSKLNHPNIATVHDFDTQEDVDFIVMEYVEGASLAEKVKTGPLAEKEISHLGSQIADALEEAHENGIVHRDLKPGNIAVTVKGRVKVLDFGLAKMLKPVSDEATTEALTQEHAVAGTLPYMSPEELRGEKADHRSDLFSFGVVLYEMATGRRPFEHTISTALADAIIHKAPEPPSTHNRKIPPGLESIIVKALDKDPEHRDQSAREMRVDLERLSAPVSVAVPKRKRVRAGRWLWAVACVAAILAAVVLLNVGGLWDRLVGEPGPRINSIAVLPLENLSGDPDQEYFVDGMTEALIADLAKIKALRVISRTSVMQYKEVRKPLREIARELDVDAVVEGSVVRSGERVRITTQLVQATPERHLWAESYERDLRDILALQSEVAWAIAREVRVVVSPDEEKRLASTVTVDPEAHEHFLMGRHFWSQGGLDNTRKAIDYYAKALEKDPEFALAYVGLAEAYVAGAHRGMPPSEAFPNARAAALRALEIDGTLAGAHAALADTKHHNWDWTGAERSFKKAIELNPGLEAVHTWYAGYLASVGRLDEAIAELKQAIRINPVLPGHVSFLGQMFYYARQYDQALEEFRNALELNPRHEESKVGIGLAYLQKSMQEQAVAVLEEAVASPGSGFHAKVGLGRAYAAQGRNSEARKLLEDLEELSGQQYVPAHMVTLIYAALGEKDQAFLWLEKDYQIRDAELVWINIEPGFDSLRDDPRFQDLVRRMNFPE